MFLGCRWVDCARPGSLYIFSLICTTPDESQACTEHDAGHAVVVRWEIRGVRGCGGYPPRGDWRRGASSECSLPRGSTFFGHTRLGWAVGWPTWIWSVASHAPWTRVSRSKEDCFLVHPPQLPQLQPSLALGRKATQAPGLWGCPGTPGLSGMPFTFGFFWKLMFLAWWIEFISSVVFVFGVQPPDSLTHKCLPLGTVLPCR